jgi:hypothetical protein
MSNPNIVTHDNFLYSKYKRVNIILAKSKAKETKKERLRRSGAVHVQRAGRRWTDTTTKQNKNFRRKSRNPGPFLSEDTKQANVFIAIKSPDFAQISNSLEQEDSHFI